MTTESKSHHLQVLLSFNASAEIQQVLPVVNSDTEEEKTMTAFRRLIRKEDA